MSRRGANAPRRFFPLAAVAAAGLFACGAAPPNGASAPEPASRAVTADPNDRPTCTVSLAPGADLAAALAAAAPGAVVCLAAGRYPASIVLARDVSLRGAGPGEVVLDAEQRGPVIAVHADDVTVRLEGLTLTGGSAPQGGAVLLTGLSRVELSGCLLHRNMARQGAGGAIYADQGAVLIERCRIADNDAPDAPAACVDGIASLRVSISLLVGEGGRAASVVRVRDGADATFANATVVAQGQASALHVSGTTSRAPEVLVRDTILAGLHALDLPVGQGPQVTVVRSVLSHAEGGFVGGGGVRIREPGFLGTGDEPYRPGPSSPARGLAEADEPDLAGRPRPQAGATAGAFEAD
ncbi:MAG: hypothetical protein CVU56_01635 [Deltaproteobacteria bacterium HGW-Deltaproteobacteria-14]|nr:MAG: hypothetical protein CVU56_01635 [Deltaproteobacteria bacterium HGW-Deltaproteobacteria-14]